MAPRSDVWVTFLLAAHHCAALQLEPWSRPLPYRRACSGMMLVERELSSGGSATVVRDSEPDELRSALFEKLEQMEGVWYSDDFYGLHGREWVAVSATLVGAGAASLVAVKVKGDANVPSGFTTWRTTGLPDVGGPSVRAEIQVRADVKDPNGFSWIPGTLVLVADDQIALSVFWSFGRSSGTFYKHQVEEA